MIFACKQRQLLGYHQSYRTKGDHKSANNMPSNGFKSSTSKRSKNKQDRSIAVITKLIKMGCDVNHLYRKGRKKTFPLMIAVENRDPTLIMTLLSANADVNMQGSVSYYLSLCWFDCIIRFIDRMMRQHWND